MPNLPLYSFEMVTFPVSVLVRSTYKTAITTTTLVIASSLWKSGEPSPDLTYELLSRNS